MTTSAPRTACGHGRPPDCWPAHWAREPAFRLVPGWFGWPELAEGARRGACCVPLGHGDHDPAGHPRPGHLILAGQAAAEGLADAEGTIAILGGALAHRRVAEYGGPAL